MVHILCYVVCNFSIFKYDFVLMCKMNAKKDHNPTNVVKQNEIKILNSNRIHHSILNAINIMRPSICIIEFLLQ